MSEGIGRKFMSLTRYQNLQPTQEAQSLPQPPLELPYPEGVALIRLPKAADFNLLPLDFKQLIEKRRSQRKYAQTPLSLDELGFLLWATQGVKRVTKRPATIRTVPSAGARHAFETYLLINRVNGLEPGLYCYLAVEHALAAVELSADMAARFSEACLGQSQLVDCAVAFTWVAVVPRMFYRYGERGYRYLHLDAGHVCQNLYLSAEAIQCGVCAVAAYDDDMMNALLHLDGEEQFVIYMGPVGKSPVS
jgi:SagB-type dehydrogenase family enzyme